MFRQEYVELSGNSRLAVSHGTQLLVAKDNELRYLGSTDMPIFTARFINSTELFRRTIFGVSDAALTVGGCSTHGAQRGDKQEEDGEQGRERDFSTGDVHSHLQRVLFVIPCRVL